MPDPTHPTTSPVPAGRAARDDAAQPVPPDGPRPADRQGRPDRSPLADDIVTHMQRLTTESQKVAQAFATQHGLGHIDLEALLHVMQAERGGDPVTAGRLGELLGVTSGAATGVIDRLERVGHVQRSRDDADRRRVLVRYSDRARAVAGAFFGPLGVMSDRVMSEFDEGELETVRRFLDGMSGAMAERAREVGGGAQPTRASSAGVAGSG